MPSVFRIGKYLIYFWMAEGRPTEPIHVHVAEGSPRQNGTKIWICKDGKTRLANNDSRIPPTKLKIIQDTIEKRSEEIIEMWKKFFGEVKYYC